MVGVRFFEDYSEIEAWLESHPEVGIISDKTPLLSNLTMQENIALIDEVHQSMSVEEAHAVALDLLTKLGLESIAFKRANHCSDWGVFAVMLLRAERLPVDLIYVVLPMALIGHVDAIGQTLRLVEHLASQKQVEILELNSNQIHYQGQACHILE